MSHKEIPWHRPSWFFGFLLLLALLPLPFGSNRPWASDLFAVLSGLLLFVMLWDTRNAKPAAGFPPRKRIGLAIIGFSIIIFWTFIQVASWPPESWHHPIWQEAQGLLGPLKGSISVDTGVFAESLLRLTGYGACFLLAFIGGRDNANAARLVRVIAMAGVAYALYGLLAQSMGSDTILWYKKWAYQGFLTSTFVNKNTYAAYAGFGLICGAALLGQRFKHITITDPLLAKRSKTAALIASLTLTDYAALFSLFLILAALALTGSRGGITSSLIGLMGFFVAMLWHKRSKSPRWLWIGLSGIILFAFFVALGGGTLLERLDQNKLGEDMGSRLQAYQLEGQAISDNPWLGFGLGSFEPAFRLYRDSSLPIWFHHAHNDYLEMMMDLGVPAAMILFLSLGLLVSCCVSGLGKRKRDAHYAAIAIGASLLVATHALLDFSLHIPAFAATYAALLGLGVAQSWSLHERES
ncbi:MAG: O-antigen ligase family protein [Bdellovibrionales bacterium]|jgi:O-antigen ligase